MSQTHPIQTSKVLEDFLAALNVLEHSSPARIDYEIHEQKYLQARAELTAALDQTAQLKRIADALEKIAGDQPVNNYGEWLTGAIQNSIARGLRRRGSPAPEERLMPQKNLTDKQVETLTDLNHQASQIQHRVINCLSNQRIGREWLLLMKHAHERMGILLERIDGQ